MQRQRGELVFRRRRHSQESDRGRPGGLHGRATGTTLLLHPDPACLWFLARDRKGGKFRDRRGEVLFIDTRKMGRMVDRTHRELTDEDITRIADTYHAWRGGEGVGDPTCPDSARPQYWKKSASTAMSVRKPRRTTGNRLRTR